MKEAVDCMERLMQQAVRRGLFDGSQIPSVGVVQCVKAHVQAQRTLAAGLGVSLIDIKCLSGELTADDFGRPLVADRGLVSRYAQLWRQTKGNVPHMSTWLMLTEPAKQICHTLFEV